MDRYKTTFGTWNKIANVYQDKFMDMDLYNDTYDLFCNYIEKTNPSVLEIGCGPGNITKYILTMRPDFRIRAIDVAPNMILLAQKNNPSARFSVMDCRNMDALPAGFDAIMCGFCMPYLSKEDCAKLIKDSSGLLNPGGIIYFSTIEGDEDQSGYEAGSTGDQSYVYYHREDYLKELLEKNRFTTLKLIRKEYPKMPDTLSTHLIFMARKV